MKSHTVARWESRSGKHWVELLKDDMGYTYDAPDCGGNLGNIHESEALTEIQRLVAMGYFQPDANKTPMKRVK